ncbi:hypothetical protein HERIO_2749 [Hepatospora eriocheir]|uniref:Uncharacterized protein n=1 Tax=Hepatospora eriocheir TaxID=1081669 RepID=A0A1X0QE34_9MICR|nr:hypothetical protein HERIO_2749 [Hepatospora eriocheir]
MFFYPLLCFLLLIETSHFVDFHYLKYLNFVVQKCDQNQLNL